MAPRAAWILAVLLVGAAVAEAGEPAPFLLEGAPASIVPPAPDWPYEGASPAAGEFRVVFRGPKAQCEARIFAVRDVQAPRTVLMDAADSIARQVGGEGFGVSGMEALLLEGHAAAQADLTVQAGLVRLEGRVRLLRASAHQWALAWGLAPDDAAPEVRRAVAAFPASLRPLEPAFHEPPAASEDPEEVVAQPAGEPPLVRRQLVAVQELLEAGAGVRLPAAARALVLEGLREEARGGGPKTREGFRDAARALAEAAGKPAEERAALATALGRRTLEAIYARADVGEANAQRLALVFRLGRKRVAGSEEDGLTRLEAQALVDASVFLGALAADREPEPAEAWLVAQREAWAARWPALDGAGRAALHAVARRAPDLAAAWAAATPTQRLALRARCAVLLRPTPAGGHPAPPADPRALRALLDAQPLDPAAAAAAVVALEPAEVGKLVDLLPAPGR